MKIIIAPDKFKGSLSSIQACNAIAAGVLQVHPDAEILQFPMADGGDGFADVLKHYLHTTTIECDTVDPLMRPIKATYQWNEIEKTAIIELAAASGLMLLENDDRNPLHTSTFGTGIMIQHAIKKGAVKIILGLGGSATNDAGLGILTALGFQLFDQQKKQLLPVGRNLVYLETVLIPDTIPAIKFDIACDVQNILFGINGAACVYAAQKGADQKTVEMLDTGLRRFAAVIEAAAGKDTATFAGAGAAGGVAAGLSAFFDVHLLKGAALVIGASRIEEYLTGAALIISGEGKLDAQSSNGKIVDHIARLGRQYRVPVIAVCGQLTLTKMEINEMNLTNARSITKEGISMEFAVKHAYSLLRQTTIELITETSAFIN